MIWLVTRFVVVPVKAALGGVKLGFWTGRVVGYRRIVVLGTGVAIGLLFAPEAGAQLRARLKARLDGGVAAPMSAAPRFPTATVVVPEPVGRPSTAGPSTGSGAATPRAAHTVSASSAANAAGSARNNPSRYRLTPARRYPGPAASNWALIPTCIVRRESGVRSQEYGSRSATSRATAHHTRLPTHVRTPDS